MARFSVWFSSSALAGLLWTAPALGVFTGPEVLGWSRGAANSAYFHWDIFQDPEGPNPPDVGQFPASLPPGWQPANVVELSGTSFITGGGNIYSFAAPIDVRCDFPNPEKGPAWRTRVIVQIRTLGSELNYAGVAVNGVPASSRTELFRQTLGGQFGGQLVETRFRFDLPDSRVLHELRFTAAASSMSLDQLAVDSLVYLPGDMNADERVDTADLVLFLGRFGSSVSLGRNGDFNADGVVDVQDLVLVLGAFGVNG